MQTIDEEIIGESELDIDIGDHEDTERCIPWDKFRLEILREFKLDGDREVP